MKITKSLIKQLIREEMDNLLNEVEPSDVLATQAVGGAAAAAGGGAVAGGIIAGGDAMVKGLMSRLATENKVYDLLQDIARTAERRPYAGSHAKRPSPGSARYAHTRRLESNSKQMARHMNKLKAMAPDVWKKVNTIYLKSQGKTLTAGAEFMAQVTDEALDLSVQRHNALKNSVSAAKKAGPSLAKAAAGGMGKKALAKLALQGVARVLGPVGLTYTAVELADYVANQYIDQKQRRVAPKGTVLSPEEKRAAFLASSEKWDPKTQEFPSQRKSTLRTKLQGTRNE